MTSSYIASIAQSRSVDRGQSAGQSDISNSPNLGVKQSAGQRFEVDGLRKLPKPAGAKYLHVIRSASTMNRIEAERRYLLSLTENPGRRVDFAGDLALYDAFIFVRLKARAPRFGGSRAVLRQQDAARRVGDALNLALLWQIFAADERDGIPKSVFQ